MAKNYKIWTVEEERRVREVHASDRYVKEMMHLFPGRTEKSVNDRMSFMKLGRRAHIDRNRSPFWALMEQIFKSGAHMTTREIAGAVGCTTKHALELLKAHRKPDNRTIHILRWRRAREGDSACVWVEVWAYGDGPDAIKPKPPTHAEHVRAQYARKKARAGKIEFDPFAQLKAA
nr:hypothetical protein HUO10_003299 [Paraburkholderia busanensis]